MTTTAVTKTKVKNLTRDIRRDADLIKDIVQSIDGLRANERLAGLPVDDIPGTLARFDASQRRVREALDQIDGTSALLREMLEVG
jgi:hypothetical protein